ncbi:MAG: hypothetical protein JRJ59_00710 [Deltaproteobacteria bacterium]|nr:hypothetical protein [Deltaproteobacteria bacterium]
MLRAILAALAAFILTVGLGCGSTPLGPYLLGSAGSMERRDSGEQVREAYSDSGYAYESVRGETRYRMVQSSGPGQEHAQEAQQFKLEMARLADKISLTLNQGGHSERQIVLLPTTFVNLDDLYRTSTFGRLCAEQLAEEMKVRGSEVVELRRSKELFILPQTGELSLSREIEEIYTTYKANALLIGTYTITAQQIILNVRLVKAKENTLMAVGTAFFERRNNLFINSLVLKEAQASREAAVRPRQKVRVSNQFVKSSLLEEDLKPQGRTGP